VSENKDSGDFFDGAGREGAPSAKLKDLKDFIKGTIVDLYEVPNIPFGKTEAVKNDDGSEQMQLVIVLQTDYRNWDKVAKVPEGEDGSAKPVSEDKGLRAVYVPKFTNIYGALGKAIKKADAKRCEIGGGFGIVVEDLEEVGKGNKKKVHRAVYTLPVAGFEVEAGEDPLADVGQAKSAVQDTPAAETKPATEKVAEAKAEAPVEEPPF
jgi:hypothetical protein